MLFVALRNWYFLVRRKRAGSRKIDNTDMRSGLDEDVGGPEASSCADLNAVEF